MAPTDLPPPQDPSQRSSAKSTQPEGQDSVSDHQMRVIGLMVGTALMFIGFLNVFLSISGGFEINVVPFLIYFGGLAVWGQAAIEIPMVRYGVMAGAIALARGFFHYGEVLFWHKQVVFWATVVIVMYFMFNEPKKSGYGIRQPAAPRGSPLPVTATVIIPTLNEAGVIDMTLLLTSRLGFHDIIVVDGGSTDDT